MVILVVTQTMIEIDYSETTYDFKNEQLNSDKTINLYLYLSQKLHLNIKTKASRVASGVQ